MEAAAEAASRASGSGEQDHQQREKRAGVKRGLADGNAEHVTDMGAARAGRQSSARPMSGQRTGRGTLGADRGPQARGGHLPAASMQNPHRTLLKRDPAPQAADAGQRACSSVWPNEAMRDAAYTAASSTGRQGTYLRSHIDAAYQINARADRQRFISPARPVRNRRFQREAASTGRSIPRRQGARAG